MKPTNAGAHGDELSNPGVAHETSDVNVRAILWFAAIVAATTIVCAVIVWGVFDLFESQAAARDPHRSPLAMPAGTMPRTTIASPYFGNAPSPQLAIDEPRMLRMHREAEDKQIHGYAWVDEKTGVTRVPIDQAKKILAGRGLPSRAGGSDPGLGTHAPAFGEASGGRTIPTGETPATAAPATSAAPAGTPGQPAAAPDTSKPATPAPAAAGHGSGN